MIITFYFRERNLFKLLRYFRVANIVKINFWIYIYILTSVFIWTFIGSEIECLEKLSLKTFKLIVTKLLNNKNGGLVKIIDDR